MAIDAQSITAGSEQTITISGATTYDFHGMTIENASSLAAGATITIKNSDDVTVYDAVYAKAFPDNWIPGSPSDSPFKRSAPIKGPIKVTISGATAGTCNIYYQKRT